MRTLTIQYSRNTDDTVQVGLANVNTTDAQFHLTVLQADAHGIEVRLPALLAGMFDLSVKDGNKGFSQRIALQ